ncbi:MAG: hypothetical protein BWX83_01295 [Candidatus Cloacimonetes bacterium ADurb.Bin117]|nr:MAG: hypothetical protein BWX83_01295 [Candidatus Cloacimonetes bacterium ADurb.Bin117]
MQVGLESLFLDEGFHLVVGADAGKVVKLVVIGHLAPLGEGIVALESVNEGQSQRIGTFHADPVDHFPGQAFYHWIVAANMAQLMQKVFIRCPVEIVVQYDLLVR